MFAAGVVVLMLTTFLSNVRCQKWCDLNCGKAENTMCAFKELNFTSTCRQIVNSMNPKIRSDLLHFHNKYRNEFAGGGAGLAPAADMMALEWDDELEQVAQRWAFQCKFNHDKCRKTPTFDQVGQNILVFGSTGELGDSVDKVHSWTDEIKYTSKNIIDRFQPGHSNGHFTQVVWASTYKLGCGEIVYTENLYNKRELVCNYGPAGNVVNRPIYLKGKPCTRCPQGTKCNPRSVYPNLCAFDKERSSTR